MINTVYMYINHLIAPPVCVACRIFVDAEQLLCMSCIQKIQPLVCRTIAITPTHDMRVFAIGGNTQPLQSLILAKHRGYKPASTALGHLVWQMSFVRHIPCDTITPIPLHWTRQAWRGYNQSHEIARVIAHHKNVSLVPLLKRTKRTQSLSRLPSPERYRSLHDAFQVIDATRIKDKHILLVDDVMASGTTLREAAKALYAHDPASITAVVVAREI